jgi:hypothetical protein
MLFRWRFAQSRVAQPGFVPTLATFASRSVILTLPRFAMNYSFRATLEVFAETHRLRTSDVEHDQEVSRKPFGDAIRESRIAVSPSDKISRSLQFIQPVGLSIAPMRNWSSLLLKQDPTNLRLPISDFERT